MEKYLQPFQLSPETLQEVSARLRKDLLRGLGKHSHHKAPVKMLPTFVRATPDGTGKDIFSKSQTLNLPIKTRTVWFTLQLLSTHAYTWSYRPDVS